MMVIIQQFFIESVYLLIQLPLGLLEMVQHVFISLTVLELGLRSHVERVAFLLKLYRGCVFGLETKGGGVA